MKTKITCDVSPDNKQALVTVSADEPLTDRALYIALAAFAGELLKRAPKPAPTKRLHLVTQAEPVKPFTQE